MQQTSFPVSGVPGNRGQSKRKRREHTHNKKQKQTKQYAKKNENGRNAKANKLHDINVALTLLRKKMANIGKCIRLKIFFSCKAANSRHLFSKQWVSFLFKLFVSTYNLAFSLTSIFFFFPEQLRSFVRQFRPRAKPHDDSKEFDELHSQLSRIEMEGNFARKNLATRQHAVGDDSKRKELVQELYVMWSAKMAEANQVIVKANELMQLLPCVAVPFSESKAWTLVACLHIQLQLCRDLRRLIYNYFVAGQYGSFANEQVKRVIENGKWFVSLPLYHDSEQYARDCWNSRSSPALACLDEKCKAKAKMRTGAIRSKILFESWLTEHFSVEHLGVSWEKFVSLSPICLHGNSVEKRRDLYLGSRHSGKIVEEEMEI